MFFKETIIVFLIPIYIKNQLFYIMIYNFAIFALNNHLNRVNKKFNTVAYPHHQLTEMSKPLRIALPKQSGKQQFSSRTVVSSMYMFVCCLVVEKWYWKKGCWWISIAEKRIKYSLKWMQWYVGYVVKVINTFWTFSWAMTKI